MNGTLQQILRDAECRYLMEAEKLAFRAYATGMGERLATMRKVEEREGQLVETVIAKLRGAHAPALSTPGVEPKLRHDVALTLRAVANAHARDDADAFQEHFAEWYGELFCVFSSPALVLDMAEAIRSALEGTLDGADSRALAPYTSAFIEEIQRWTSR